MDWTIGDDQRGSIYEKPVAWINTSARGAVHADQSLRLVLGYAKAVVVEPACVHVPVSAADVDERGLIADRGTRDRVAGALVPLGEHVGARCREIAVPALSVSSAVAASRRMLEPRPSLLDRRAQEVVASVAGAPDSSQISVDLSPMWAGCG